MAKRPRIEAMNGSPDGGRGASHAPANPRHALIAGWRLAQPPVLPARASRPLLVLYQLPAKGPGVGGLDSYVGKLSD